MVHAKSAKDAKKGMGGRDSISSLGDLGGLGVSLSMFEPLTECEGIRQEGWGGAAGELRSDPIGQIGDSHDFWKIGGCHHLDAGFVHPKHQRTKESELGRKAMGLARPRLREMTGEAPPSITDGG
jgi:hypothetical protein